MKALLQRVSEASVVVEEREVARIGKGVLLLLGVETSDDEKEAEFLAWKCAGLRYFQDDQRKMNLSVSEVDGEVLVVSQFTLCADTRKGKRPSFDKAAPPERAKKLIALFVSELRKAGLQVKEGVFGAYMKVKLVNEGPVTLILTSPERVSTE